MTQRREQMPWATRPDGEPKPPSAATATALSRGQGTDSSADTQADKTAPAGCVPAPAASTAASMATGAQDANTRTTLSPSELRDEPSNGPQKTPDEPTTESQDRSSRVARDSRPGRYVGRYQMGELLGQGSMGSVYAGFDPKLERPVALKLLRSRPSESARTRLEREARALARLSHPNVVRVYDAGVVEDRVFIAMELVAGQSLKEWCRRQPAPGWREVLRVYLEAARGIAAAHARGLVHRDIKPANILIGNDGRVRVADFGLAAAQERNTDRDRSQTTTSQDEKISSASSGLQTGLDDRLTQTGAVLGTPAFMAPEQHLGEEVGPAADQYSFCMSLYRGVYGTLPFPMQRSASGLVELCMRKLRGPTGPAPVAPQVPSWLYQVILRGLAPEPGHRYPSMDALIAALEPALRPRSRLRRVRVLGLAAGVAVCVAAVTGVYWHNRAGLGHVCQDASAALAGIWDPATKDRVRAAFLGTGLGYAPHTFSRVAALLDGYAAAWTSMRTETCEATRVYATQSAAVMDLRIYCLDRRRQKLDALTKQYAAGPDPDLLPRAITTTQALPPLAHCVDVEALRSKVLPPNDTAVRTRVEQLYPRVYQLEALHEAGKYRHGLERGQALLTEMVDLSYTPLRARAELAVAQLQQGAGDHAGAESRLRATIDLATRAGDDALLATAWTHLIVNVGVLQDRHQEALDLRPPMNAAVERADDDLIRARALNSTGQVFDARNAYEDARGFYERAMVLWERVLGPNHPMVAGALTNLGLVLYRMNKYEQAIAMHTRAWSINENALGPEHPRVAAALNNLALVFEEVGRYQEAQDHYERVVRIYEHALGPEHPTLATTLSNLGVVLNRIGNHEAASSYHERALRIQEQTFGPEHSSVATSLNNLAISFKAMGRFQEAKDYHERVLRLQEQIFGSENSSVALARNNLAVVLDNMGRYQEAQKHYQRALAIYAPTLGPEHSQIALVHSNLAVSLDIVGNYAAAQLHYRRALAMYQRLFGPEHASVARVLNNMGVMLARMGRYREAKQHHERALATHKRTVGSEHSSVAISLDNLAIVFDNMGRHQQAKAHRERAVAIGEAALGPNHPRLADMLSRLGGTVLRLGQLAAAERYLARAEDILSQVKTPHNASTARMLRSRGELAMAHGRPREAVAFLESALGLDRVTSALRVETQFALARALWAVGADKARAVALAEEAQTIYQQVGNQPMRAKVNRWLAAKQSQTRGKH